MRPPTSTALIEDSAQYAQAVFNMLEDLSEERERMGAAQRALVNILEDSAQEKELLESGREAIVNILEDTWQERGQLENTQQAVLNILEDLEAEREQIRHLNSRLEDRVRERTNDLERSNRNMAAFTYSVAHDLRAPLRATSGFSQALLTEYGDSLDGTARGYAERVLAGSARMALLIDDLLHLSRVSRAELHREPLDLSMAARSSLAELAAHDKGRRVECVIEDGITAPVDHELFRTVLDNLLGNAWKFTSTRAHARIEFIRAEAPAGQVAFTVKDNGVGFDPEYTEKLFQPFERLHSTDDYPGTGIGLASVLQVVERHGGSIRGEGAPNEGASFHVVLPGREQTDE